MLQTIDYRPIGEVTGTSVVVVKLLRHLWLEVMVGLSLLDVDTLITTRFVKEHFFHNILDRFFLNFEELLNLQSKTAGRCAYMQADVCDFDSLRKVIASIQSLYGPIENIVHTAAVVSDAMIQTVSDESFEP